MNDSNFIIQTPRLELIALSAEIAITATEDRALLSQMLNATVPDEFPPEIMADAMSFFAETLKSDPNLRGWWAWYIIATENPNQRTLIGSAGFNGYPDESGTLVIGYAIIDSYQNQGYATEAVKALIGWAFLQPQVNQVVAETFPDLPASIRVMEKTQMVYLGAGSDAGTVKYGVDCRKYHG
ncbi:GNAT family N-acetyltransferase [[Phormidium] sp. ETS-05]|uniref:GNAT family N-acetyltransferase n=1 Tax=[Phormidium] sp. ETS-05 TaxID=222819 RepID=UPI0018EF0B71|nr:GNAT family N-acetyltransferase [[Phormidium] sp. ETS-05]